MNENPNHPEFQDTVYLTKKNKKTRRTRIVIYIILALFLSGIIAYISIPIRERLKINHLNHLATLPFPELSKDYQSRLIINESPIGFPIKTQWLTTNKLLDDRNMFAGFIRVQAAHSHTFYPHKKYPPTSITLYISAQHPARLPLNDPDNSQLTLIAHQTIIIPNDLHGQNLTNVSPQSNSDTTLFNIPTQTYIAAINHGSITLKLADHTINFTDDQFQTLKDFAATLKPGLSPP